MYEHVFRYCERGLDPSFWAEPLNAVTNAAFLIAAAAAYAHWRDRPPYERSNFVLLLIVLVFVIGLGSFLFHTFADKWSGLADVVPIGVFMLFYLGYALVKFAGFGWRGTVLSIGAFILAFKAAGQVRCHDGHVSFLTGAPGGAETLCINGGAEYLPALVAMAALGAWLLHNRRPTAGYVLGAAGVFLASLTLRSLDFTLCDSVAVGGRRLGTHFLWHILNAATLYLLLLAALKHKPVWRRLGLLSSSAGERLHLRTRRHRTAPPAAAPHAKLKNKLKNKPKPEIIPPRPGAANRRFW